jgi:hypothetical protein
VVVQVNSSDYRASSDIISGVQTRSLGREAVTDLDTIVDGLRDDGFDTVGEVRD